MLAQNGLGKKCRGKYVRVPKGSADGLDGRRLVARRAGRQTASGNIGGRIRRIVAQSLLRLINVGEAEIHAVVLIEDMIEPNGHVRDRLF